MHVHVNDQRMELADGATVADALAAFGAPTTGVAVAVDGAVVVRSAWTSTELCAGAVLEVLTAVQGG